MNTSTAKTLKKPQKSETKLKKDKNQNLKLTDSRFSISLNDGRILCKLCPINCRIPEGKSGKCKVRKNINGSIYLTNYRQVVQASIDSLKNRPLYLLGEENIKSLSIGLTGCNNTCPFCQNWLVSQSAEFSESYSLSPKDLIKHAIEHKVDYISFTYTEPIVWIEYIFEISKLARKNGIKLCLKTAGYISPEFATTLLDSVDVINLDIKPMNSKYLLECGISDDNSIWNFAKEAVALKKHLEISHIVIPTVNDNEESIFEFSKGTMELGSEIGIHLLIHYPAWKSNYPRTTEESMSFWKKYLENKGHKNVFVEEVG